MATRQRRLKNEALSKFIAERRAELRLSRAEVNKALGLPTHSSGCHWWEERGTLPSDSAMLDKFAKVLKTTREELLQKAGVNLSRGVDTLPLMEAVLKTGVSPVTLDDFSFLLELQTRFAEPMHAELIKQLLTQRKLGR